MIHQFWSGSLDIHLSSQPAPGGQKLWGGKVDGLWEKPWKIVTIKDTTWYNHCSAQIACPKNCFFRVGEKNNMQWAPKLNINRCWTQPLLKWTVFKTLSSSLQNWLDKNGIPHSWIVMPNGQCYPQSQPTISYTVIPANQSPKFDT